VSSEEGNSWELKKEDFSRTEGITDGKKKEKSGYTFGNVLLIRTIQLPSALADDNW
jgi:hypothetical protein